MLPPKSLTTTNTPRFANSKAYRRPKPRPPPVTTATCSLKSIMVETPSSTRPDNGGRVRNENLVMRDLAELPGHRRHRPQRAVPSKTYMRSNQMFVPFRKPPQGCSGYDVSGFEPF